MKKKDNLHEAKLKLGEETYTASSMESELAIEKVSYKALHKTKYQYVEIPAGMHVVNVKQMHEISVPGGFLCFLF